ncbi:hypothetical protein H4Q26_008305 [Puccinia striiformis f. sp. tritici PST-130]|nr:hypothetical protein H4Q26_008305 [Puccinia striiformis f. sp. tritici PST-130]
MATSSPISSQSLHPWRRLKAVIKLPGKPIRPQNMSSKIADTLNIASKHNQQQHQLTTTNHFIIPYKLYEEDSKSYGQSCYGGRTPVKLGVVQSISMNSSIGCLQSPFLESPKIPRAPANLFI